MRQRLLFSIALFIILGISNACADDLDDFILAQLKKRHVSGLSLAIIQDGKIVKAKGYGFTDRSQSTPITPTTLFQAGSISKSVAAVGALYLVERNKLSLDEDVNTKLRTWKVPDNEFTSEKKVTLRGLLSHTTGLTVHGFPGYAVGAPIPTVVQILDGSPPANTAPVRVDFVPGTRWRYSGGGYTVMQQLVVDITGQPYPKYMQETVLSPLHMTASTYSQPLPPDKAKVTATGYYADQSLVQGRWHIYPEMAAAGLWTTASDLARFAIGIQNAFTGKAGGVLSQTMTQQMLTDQKDHDGLGVFLEGEGRFLRFGHSGRDEGFDAYLTATATTGQGVAIMINANDNSRLVKRIAEAVANQYQWPSSSVAKTPKRTAAPVSTVTLKGYEGRYEFTNNQMITFVADSSRLFTLVDGLPDEEFVAQTATHFVSTDRDTYLTFNPDAQGHVNNVIWLQGKEERTIPRIGSFLDALPVKPDPNPTRTRTIEAALKAMAEGGKAVAETPGITPGARKDFASGLDVLADLKSIAFLQADDVSGRGIERHEGKVAQILSYKLTTNKAQQYILVYLTSDGLVTDYDVVSK